MTIKKKCVTNQEKTFSEATIEKAKNLENKIIANSFVNQKFIYEFCHEEHFLALDHDSLKSWAMANQNTLGRSYDSFNNDYHAARITVDMCGEGSIGKYTPHALLQMKNLDHNERKKVFEYAQKHFDLDELEAKHLTFSNVKQFIFKIENIEEQLESDFLESLKGRTDNEFANQLAIAIDENITPNDVFDICEYVLSKIKKPNTFNAIKQIKSLKLRAKKR